MEYNLFSIVSGGHCLFLKPIYFSTFQDQSALFQQPSGKQKIKRRNRNGPWYQSWVFLEKKVTNKDRTQANKNRVSDGGSGTFQVRNIF